MNCQTILAWKSFLILVNCILPVETVRFSTYHINIHGSFSEQFYGGFDLTIPVPTFQGKTWTEKWTFEVVVRNHLFGNRTSIDTSQSWQCSYLSTPRYADLGCWGNWYMNPGVRTVWGAPTHDKMQDDGRLGRAVPSRLWFHEFQSPIRTMCLGSTDNVTRCPRRPTYRPVGEFQCYSCEWCYFPFQWGSIHADDNVRNCGSQSFQLITPGGIFLKHVSSDRCTRTIVRKQRRTGKLVLAFIFFLSDKPSGGISEGGSDLWDKPILFTASKELNIIRVWDLLDACPGHTLVCRSKMEIIDSIQH